jgi:hypothetical protein
MSVQPEISTRVAGVTSKPENNFRVGDNMSIGPGRQTKQRLAGSILTGGHFPRGNWLSLMRLENAGIWVQGEAALKATASRGGHQCPLPVLSIN